MQIEKDKVSPDELAKMKDEYGYELIKREEYDKGARQNALDNAKKMLANGIELSLISKITGLPADEILKLS
jgi:hypothetical protein